MLTVLSLVLLALRLAAGVRQGDRLHPATRYSMFSHASDGLNVELVWARGRVEGDGVRVCPEDRELTELQLRRNVVHEVVAVGPDRASERLAQIATRWGEREHREVAGLSLGRVERWVDGRQVPLEQVARWTR